MRAHFEILTSRNFTGEYCKVLNINLRKWLDIPMCKKSTYTQKCMFIKISRLVILIFGWVKLGGLGKFNVFRNRSIPKILKMLDGNQNAFGLFC